MLREKNFFQIFAIPKGKPEEYRKEYRFLQAELAQW